MIIGCMLVRNEAGRWLEDVLREMAKVCGRIVILDDCSTDETPEICARHGQVHRPFDRPLWGEDELKLRKELWYLATADAETGDWILCLDADEVTVGLERLPDIIYYALKSSDYIADGVAFGLYDMWDAEHYRTDALWSAHERPWVMCIRYRDGPYTWRETPLHCGRFPIDAANEVLDANTIVKIKHMGWSRPEDRAAKYARYMAADPEGRCGNLLQYESILDEHPNLVKFE